MGKVLNGILGERVNGMRLTMVHAVQDIIYGGRFGHGTRIGNQYVGA